jgi:septum formation protein
MAFSLNKLNLQQPLILASKSPRRAQLLKEAGLAFEVIPSELDESKFHVPGQDAVDLAQRLAREKARAIALRFPDRLVLGADTLMDCQGQIIGKPINVVDAETILRKLFFSSHRAVTGIALLRIKDGTELVGCDTTSIYPGQMTEADIRAHLKEGRWKGKAGAYAIQEGDDRFIEKLDGSRSNVIGLPMELLGELLGRVI